MITTPYEDRVRYLKSRTDTSNRNLEKAFVPEFIDGGCVSVQSHVFDDDFVLSSSASLRIFQTENLLFNGMTDRTRTVIDSTITIMGKRNETFNDLSKVVGVSALTLISFNRDKFLDGTTVTPETSVYGIVIDTRIPATLQNLIRMKVVKPFMCFLDGLFIPLDKITLKTDLYNDYIMIDLSWMKDKSLIKDYNRLDMLQYIYLSPDTTDNVLFTFDGNGSITSTPTTPTDNIRYHVYSLDPHVFIKEMFVDSTTHKGTFGTMFNERVDGLHYKNKVKPENVICFQNGKLVKDCEVICNNFNIITVKYKEFARDSRAVVIYSKPVCFTEDNALRLAESVVSTLGETFEDFLDDTELSCQTFINEIYAMDAEKYGFTFTPVHINNAEEYPTPWDEIITYNNPHTKDCLYHLISEIFEKDSENVRTVMKGIVDNAFATEYSVWTMNDEWMLRKNLPEMFSHEEKEDPNFFNGMGGLNKSFDFFFYDTKSFEENFLSAIEYISKYDSDKLECGLKRYEVSAVTTGAGLHDFIDTEATLKMVRGAANLRENYVMIFVNGNIYSGSDNISYHDRYFEVENFLVDNDDKIEIIYFLKCNNTIMPLTINDSVVTTEYLYNKDEVQLWSNITPHGIIAYQEQVYQVPYYITDPWVRGHGTPGPLPTGGGVEFINGPVIYFDDIDTGYDAFVNIYSETGLTAVKDLIDQFITDTETKNILYDAADAAYAAEFPKSTIVNSYASLPEDPENGDIIFYVGSDYMLFKRYHHYKYNSTLTDWEEYFSTADQSNMYSELSLRSHLADTINDGGFVNRINDLINAIRLYTGDHPENCSGGTRPIYEPGGSVVTGSDTFYTPLTTDGVTDLKAFVDQYVPALEYPEYNTTLKNSIDSAYANINIANAQSVAVLPTTVSAGTVVLYEADNKFYSFMPILTPGTSGFYMMNYNIQSGPFVFWCTETDIMTILLGGRQVLVCAGYYGTGGYYYDRIINMAEYISLDYSKTYPYTIIKDLTLGTTTLPAGTSILASNSITLPQITTTIPSGNWSPVDASVIFGVNGIRHGLSSVMEVNVPVQSTIELLMAAIYAYSLTEEEEEPGEPEEEEPETDWYLIPDPEMYKLMLTPSDLLFWDGATGWTTSKRQFRYTRITVDTLGARKYQLPEQFKFCTNPRKYLIFVNGRCVPRSYVVIAPSKGIHEVIDTDTMPATPTAAMMNKFYHYIGEDTATFLQNHYYVVNRNPETLAYYWAETDFVGSNPVGHIEFYTNITLAVNDVIDIYYVPDEMCTDYNESVLKRNETTNSGYIKINQSNTMTGISTTSSFVFINGRKISSDEVKDISADMVKVTDEYPNPASMTLSLEVYRYLYSDEYMTLKAYAPNEMDKLIPEEPDVVDVLMDTHTEPSGNETEKFPNRLSKDAVKSSVLLDYASSDNSWLAEF